MKYKEKPQRAEVKTGREEVKKTKNRRKNLPAQWADSFTDVFLRRTHISKANIMSP